MLIAQQYGCNCMREMPMKKLYGNAVLRDLSLKWSAVLESISIIVGGDIE